MTFSLDTFRSRLGTETPRPHLFRVLLDNDETLSFLINRADVSRDYLTLTILENENGYVIDRIKKLWRRFPIKIELYRPSGELATVLEGERDVNGEIEYSSSFDWGSVDSLLFWRVSFPVSWK